MKIAVISDIHDHIHHLDAALSSLHDCDLLMCCGDLNSPFIIDQLARGFAKEIHIVFGNNDADLYRITLKSKSYPNVHLHGEFLEQDWGGRRMAVNHFDNIGRALAAGGQYDAVFFGHNHTYENEVRGRTLVLNPGSIMGAQFGAQAKRTDVAPTFAIYDTETNRATGYRLDSASKTFRTF